MGVFGRGGEGGGNGEWVFGGKDGGKRGKKKDGGASRCICYTLSLSHTCMRKKEGDQFTHQIKTMILKSHIDRHVSYIPQSTERFPQVIKESL